MGDQRLLHGTRGDDGTEQYDRGQQAGVQPGVGRVPAMLADQAGHGHDDPYHRGGEGQPDADVTGDRRSHQWTFPSGARTRLGCWAM